MEIHFVLITLGGLFLIGLATDELGRRTRLPRVTLLMLFGVLIGPAGLDILAASGKGLVRVPRIHSTDDGGLSARRSLVFSKAP